MPRRAAPLRKSTSAMRGIALDEEAARQAPFLSVRAPLARFRAKGADSFIGVDSGRAEILVRQALEDDMEVREEVYRRLAAS